MNDSTARLTAMAREVAKDPGSPLYPELAMALIDAGRYADAVKVCQRGLEAAPERAGRRVLAEALLLLGRVEEARANAKTLLQESEQDAVALRVLGASFLASGDEDAARPFIERSARLDPSDMQTLDLLAQLPRQAEDSPEKTASEHTQDTSHGQPDAALSVFASGEAAEGPPGALFEETSPPKFEPDLPEPDAEPTPPVQLEPDCGNWSEPAFQASEVVSGAPACDDESVEAGSDEPERGSVDSNQLDEEGPVSSWASWEAGDAAGTLELDDIQEKDDEPALLDLDDDELTEPPKPEERGPVAAPEKEPSASMHPSDTETSSDEPCQESAEAGSMTASDDEDTKARKLTLGSSGGVSVTPFWRQFQSLGSTPSSRLPTAALIAFFSKSPLRKFGIPAAAALIALLLISAFALSWKKERDRETFEEAMALAAAAIRVDTEEGYREAMVHLEEALERRANDPEVLGLLAFSAARIHTAFEGGIESAVLAEDYLALAESQPVLTPKGAAARGVLHLASDRPADAVSTAARGLGNHPGHPALLWVRSQAQLELDREDLALTGLKEARANDPAFLPATTLLSKVLSSSGAKQEAHSLRLEIISEHPLHLETLFALFEEASTDFSDPSVLLDSLLEASSFWDSLPAETLCKLHLQTARIALLANRPSAAGRAEDLARATEPGSSCQAALGGHLLARHRPNEALQCLSAVADRVDSGAKLLAARAALAAGRPDWVIDSLSPNGEALEQALLASAFHVSGRPREALKTAETATQARPADPEAFATLAIISRAEGNLVAARHAAHMSRVASPSPWQAIATGLAYLELNEARRATSILDAAVGRARAPNYSLLVTAGRAAATSGRLPEAIRHLEEAIALNPEAEPALEMYLSIAPKQRAASHLASLCEPWGAALAGLSFVSAGEIDEARAQYDLASSQGGGYWTELLGARIAAREGKFDLATIRRLVRENQGRMMPRILLAEVLLGLGRPAEAVEVLRDGLKRHPRHAQALTLLVEARAIIATDPHAVVDSAREVLRLSASQPLENAMLGRLHGALALSCATAGNVRCARSAANQARRHARREGRVQFLVGRTLELLGDIGSARSTYSLAGQAFGGEEALLRYALISEGADATKALQEFLVRAPDHALAGQARQALVASP